MGFEFSKNLKHAVHDKKDKAKPSEAAIEDSKEAQFEYKDAKSGSKAKQDAFQIAALHNWSKSSFSACFLHGKLAANKPSISKLELIHLNKKSQLVKDFSLLCTRCGLNDKSFNKNLI